MHVLYLLSLGIILILLNCCLVCNLYWDTSSLPRHNSTYYLFIFVITYYYFDVRKHLSDLQAWNMNLSETIKGSFFLLKRSCWQPLKWNHILWVISLAFYKGSLRGCCYGQVRILLLKCYDLLTDNACSLAFTFFKAIHVWINSNNFLTIGCRACYIYENCEYLLRIYN